MKSLTLACITHRHSPRFDWLWDSFIRQVPDTMDWHVILVDLFKSTRTLDLAGDTSRILHVAPKPNVWQGEHRLTAENWWAAANARNTAAVYCNTDWIAYCDDRAVLTPGWIDAVLAAMAGQYVVVGPYEKREEMIVKQGQVFFPGDRKARDSREEYVETYWSERHCSLTNPYPAPCGWLFGCSVALPLEWLLAVNGWPEECDSLSGEDYCFGRLLENNKYPIKYDLRMRILEDRTPHACGPVMKRTDKGKSPQDKSHWMLDQFATRFRSKLPKDLAALRASVRAGQPLPLPDAPLVDDYDGQSIASFA